MAVATDEPFVPRLIVIHSAAMGRIRSIPPGSPIENLRVTIQRRWIVTRKAGRSLRDAAAWTSFAGDAAAGIRRSLRSRWMTI